MSVWIDGEPGDRLDIRDRGLAYGDGLFETMALIDGQLRHAGRHLARLRRGCERLGMPTPDASLWRRMLAPALVASPAKAVVKLIVTRGSGGRGYRPPGTPRPRWIVQRLPWPDYPDTQRREGIALRHCRTPLAINPALAGLKHLNRLEQVLARAEWDGPEEEGLMRDPAGQVICGTQSNLFWVEEGRLFTPPLDQCGIEGITRARIMDALPVTVAACRPERLEQAEAVLVCNSLMGVVPVRRLDARLFDLPEALMLKIEALLAVDDGQDGQEGALDG